MTLRQFDSEKTEFSDKKAISEKIRKFAIDNFPNDEQKRNFLLNISHEIKNL